MSLLAQVELTLAIERGPLGVAGASFEVEGGERAMSVQEEVRAIWEAVDADQSGSLDEAEMREVLTQLGNTKSLKPKPFAKMFKKLDPDGDGTIDFDTFATWAVKQDRRKAAKALASPKPPNPKEEEEAELRKMQARNAPCLPSPSSCCRCFL
jgi:hypothetical protein